MTNTAVGIYGLGTYLPETIRDNSWWPKSFSERWHSKRRQGITRGSLDDPGVELTDGVKRVLAAMSELEHDPFQGIKQRRVIDDDMPAAELGIRAARQALESSGTEPGQIDFLIEYCSCPDMYGEPGFAPLHKDLGLRQDCLALTVDGACNSFLVHLDLATQLIRSGRGKRGLLVQSNIMSRLADPAEPFSVWFGDGASAAVVGTVSSGLGVVAHAHHTDSLMHGAVGATVPGGRWFDDGRVVSTAPNRALARKMLLLSADRAKLVLLEAIEQAHLRAEEIDFFAGHQASKWFRRVAQEHTGLTTARSLDIFEWAGNLGGANLPLILSIAQQEGLLAPGDCVAMMAGGAGMTWSSAILRWGT